jgi:hypothetical protein
MRIRDPGWKKVGSGIRVKHPGSATLETNVKNCSMDALPYSLYKNDQRSRERRRHARTEGGGAKGGGGTRALALTVLLYVGEPW